MGQSGRSKKAKNGRSKKAKNGRSENKELGGLKKETGRS